MHNIPVQPDSDPLLKGNTPTTHMFPLGFSDFHFCAAWHLSRLVSSTFYILYLTLFSLCYYGFAFAPLGCLAWPLAQISTHSVPQPSQSFGRTIFLHACSAFPSKVPAFTPPCTPCTTPLNRGLWQLGKGMSQKKNMPHGKLYLYTPNTYLRGMSQAYPENWERAAAPSFPTSVTFRIKQWFCFVLAQNSYFKR